MSNQNSESRFPLSIGQRGRWFAYQREPHTQGEHNIAFAARVKDGALDLQRLEWALGQLIERHPMLRARIVHGDTGPLQVITDDHTPILAALSVDGRDEAVLSALVAAEAERPFDLAGGPLFRTVVFHSESAVGDVLLLVFDHLICDGWSFWQLLEELGKLLEHDTVVRGADGPALQYRDYVMWLDAWRQGEEGSAQLAFWRPRLEVCTEVLDIACARRKLPGERGVTETVSHVLRADLTEGLRNCARQHRLGSLFTVLLGGYQILLHRYSGQPRIVVGSPMPARTDERWDEVVGDFVNPVVLLAEFAADSTVAQFLAKQRMEVAGAMANQDYPFAALLEQVRIERDSGVNPVFQTMFVFQHARRSKTLTRLWRTDGDTIAWGGLTLSSYPLHKSGGSGGLGVALEVLVLDDEIRCDFKFDQSVFDRVAVERMARHYARVLEAMVTDPAQAISRLPMLDAEEQQALVTGPALSASLEAGLVHELFEEQAARNGAAKALVCGAERLTYAQLNGRANRLAHVLRALGVAPGRNVAICLPRSIEMVVAILAVLKAGGTYVPLDPDFPQQRIAFLVEDCSACLLVGHAALKAADLGVPVLALDSADGPMLAASEANLKASETGVTPAHPAYVIYTSGSTGQPKGVMIEHRNVPPLVLSRQYMQVNPGDAIALCSNPAFDASPWEMWSALLNGARLLIVPPAVLLDAQAFAHALTEERVNIALFPTGLFNAYAGQISTALHSLDYLLVGGDTLDPRPLARLLADGKGPRHLLNAYGPTEATTIASTFEIGRLSADARNVPIGRPISGTRIYILDAHLQVVPTGVAGEIYIAGAGVAQGYLGRQNLTEERFLPDPFSADPAARMYRTGDMGRWLESGDIEHMGRNDFQVKIRGFRIELGEIEARLATCAGVREAVVVALGEGADKRLVAYLVPVAGAQLEAGALRAALAQQVAEYMIPSAFVTLDAFPLTPNGKLDRKALPAPDAAAFAAREYAPPQGAVEEAIAAIWQELLGVEKVGRHDHFFELGGHSLLAIQLIARLRRALGVDLAVRALFGAPTLADQAALAQAAQPAAVEVIPPADRSQALPLSWSQQRLWFLDRMDPAASAAYHMPARLLLRGRLDVDALRAALTRIVARHEVLRTRFIEHDGQPVQRIDAAAEFALAARDLSAMPGHEQAGAVERHSLDEASAPFDLAQGPPIRGQLLRLAEQEHVLLLTQHHIVSDGWSIGVLIDEVRTLYTAFSQGLADPLPPLALQYADYAQWQRGWLRGERLERQLAFWRGHLGGAPALLELPLDRPRPAQQSYAGAALPLRLPAALADGLRQLARQEGATLFMTLLAGWSVLLSRLSGQGEVVTGTPVANRQRGNVEGLIGFFVNTLALRVTVEDDPTVAQLLAQVKASTLDAYSHQDVAFEQVVEVLKPPRSTSHSPIFQVMFSLNNTPSRSLTLPGLTLEGMAQDRRGAQFELSLELEERDGSVEGSLTYSTALFDAATVARFGQYFETILAGMVAGAQQAVSRLPLLDEAGLAQLASFNATARGYPSRLIHELFEEQVARDGAATALVCGAERLSYAQLNERANRLAHYLRALGIGPDERVAICVERSVEMVVGLLAILKAGGAYVPLEPDYPAERLAYMLDDCAPRALLTHSALRARLDRGDLPVLELDRLDAVLAGQPDSNPAHGALRPDHLAYVIYTSGSTGLPKGVMVQHGSVCNLALQDGYAALSSNDCVAQCANVAFDASTWEIWGALVKGARLLVVPQATLLDSEVFDACLDGEGVTAMWLTVGLFNTYADRLQRAFKRIRYLLIGGDRLDPRPVAMLLASDHAPLHLINGYGPTEATTFTTTYEILQGAAIGRNIPIGRALVNVNVYILDRHRRLVPPGVPGEIYIGGAQVARGYLNRPELTAERFLADPFSAVSGARMYRTGDLARWLPDGNIDYLGRNDFQVKIRGFRIELGEIEARLATCAGVREAVVVALGEGADKRLVAYLVPVAGAQLEAGALRAALAQQVAEYMIPSAFVTLDAFPLTPNGKLDRKALPAPDAAAFAAREYAPPQGAVEEAIAAIWQELLGVEKVGRHDHFFELGGHSLLAIQLIARLRRALGVDLAVRALFGAPTLADQAALAQAAQPAAVEVIPPADRSQALPLSWSQQRLWFLDRMDPAASAAYHMPARLLLRGRLDVDALRAALTRIVARHEVLRTRFIEHDGQPVQRIDAAAEFALAARDLSAMPGHEQAGAVERHSLDEASAPFDLAQGPPIRGQLLRLAEQEHVLLLTQHHIVSDGWSIGVLIDEVRTLYTAFSQGLADPLPPLALQYADYAQWQRGWLRGERLERQLAFWRGHLGGAPALLELPLDRPRPAQQSYAGAALPLRLPAALADGLRQLARQEGATLFMTLLAGWSVLLSRLSGQGEVVTGTPVANRQRGNVEGLIGFFVNTLALRVTVEDDPTVAQLLAQVKGGTLDAYGHQDVPFEQVVEVLKPPRSTSHSPIFQVMFSLNNTPSRSLTLPGLTLEGMAQDRRGAQFELSLELEERDGNVEGSLTYSTALFDAATVARFGQYFETILAGMVAGAQQAVSRLPLLDEAGLAQLASFNATARGYPSRLIHELFEEQVARDGAATALVCGAERLSYAQLNERANRLAHYLRALGIGPDERVAICVERSVEMVVGLLAILKAGGAYVPLEPDYPAERLAYMLDDCAPRALLTHSALRARLDRGDLPVLELDRLDAVLAGQPDSNPAHGALRPDHLAYVIYTSGSTGKPKGVMNQHNGVVNRLLWGQETYRLTAQDRVLQKTPMGFDVSVWEFFLPLLAGAQLVMARPQGHQDPHYLAEVIESKGITIMHFVPSMLQLFLPRADARRCASLRRVLCSGEALSTALQQHFHRCLPNVELHNLYGPTEAAVEVTAWHCLPEHEDTSVPIGRPIANTAMYVLDRQGQPVPLGVAGELYIGGVQVARGYWNRPELTAERFVVDPFSIRPQARMYKTGDVARWLANGAIEYLGRNDFQVKLRGQRIELGEIEARLAACKGVAEVAVTARGEGGDMRLVAYVVPQAGAQLEAADLRAALAQQMAEYMIPSAFVTLDAFPLTPNGKLDRKALPAPDTTAFAAREYAPPQGEVEEAIAAIWQELLGVERVGRHDHFFELGGHSLLAIQLIARMRQELDVDLALRALFAEPTLEAQAMLAQAAQSATVEVILPADRSQASPLSWSQQRLWFLDRMDPSAGAAYHMPARLLLRGRLDVDALRAALTRIVARHEVLRTRFVEHDGQPVQQIDPPTEFALAVRDLSAMPGHEQASAVERHSLDAASAPFDLAQGPLIRGQLLRLAEQEHVLLLTQHHIVSDGWSIGVLIDEVRTLYTAFSQGLADPLPPLALQYADYAQWQRGWLRGERLERQLAFWRGHLGGAPALLELPLDRPRPAQQSYAGAALPLRLPAALADGLRQLARQEGATLFMTLLAGWSVLLSRLSGQGEVVTGTPVANRQRGNVEGLIGFFVNTLALRVTVEDDPTVAQLLAQVKGSTLDAYGHQDVPFEQVVEVLKPPRSTSHSPIFQVMLGLNNTPSGELSLPDLTLEPMPLESDTIPCDLHLAFQDDGDAITGNFRYASALFDRATVISLCERFEQILRSMVADPAQPVSRLNLLREGERALVLERFNASAVPFAPGRTIHGAFEAQAARTPHAPALAWQGRVWSYDELNRQANRVAHALLAHGVKPDQFVGLCTPRGADMIVGLLGILKAGAAYVPLDPAYPSERLDYIVQDCAPAVVLAPVDWPQAARWQSAQRPVLCLDMEGEALRGQPEHDPDAQALGLHDEHLAYVIYTSGSTGAAKGVMVQHRSAVNFWEELGRSTHRQCPAGAQVALNASFAFDMSLKGILQLLSGHCLHIVPQEIRADGAAMLRFLAEHRIDAFDCTPSQLEVLLAAGLLTQGDYRPTSVLIGGEALSEATWEILRASPITQFYNMYGPTECTVDVTLGLINGADAKPHIGKPLGNARVYILDPHRQPVPVGMAGELYLGGMGVARGYLNRPELNAERFLPDPFAGQPGARMYKSGDLGSWREDGAITYLGRNDFQVKLRGFRIELGEIEAALRACEEVKDGVVLVREDSPGDRRLVAYVTARAGQTPTARALRDTLARHLTEYMLPSAFVVLDAFPLTPNGKLDRRALPMPDEDASARSDYAGPEGEMERAIAAIWQELLGVSHIGRDDNFFELGGHSLIAVQLLSRISEQFGVDIGLATIFQTPDLRQLADITAQHIVEQCETEELERIEREMAEMSPEQMQAWLDAQPK